MTTDGREFGAYRLLEELGRGGQGTVWLAEDSKLKRKVALKVLSTAAGALSDDQVARFRREAEAASKLDHPNICGLLDAGEIDGTPFLAYRFVEGHTLAERIAQSYSLREGIAADGDVLDAPDPGSRAGIERIVAQFEKLARALHAAHEKGLVHRDVKPGNVMITPDGEPVLLDFGLARDELGDDVSLTHSGDLLGTPAYMSPEQLTAHRVPLDRRTDVYSLGATLYEALTLHKPFTGRTRAELYQRILAADPSSVSALNRQIPHDLRVVVETAIDKDRNRRYQTTLDLAEDLRRFRQFEPVKARPIGHLLKLRRWAQRHPARATGVALLTLALALSLFFLRQLSRSLEESNVRELVLASRAALDKDQHLALLLAEAAVRKEDNASTFGALHEALLESREERVLPVDSQPMQLELLPDGRFVSASLDGTIRIWTWNGDLVQVLPPPNAPVATQIDVRADGRILAAYSAGRIRIWNPDDKRPTHDWALDEGAAVSNAAWVAGSQVVVSRADGSVSLYELDGTLPRSLVSSDGSWAFAAPSPDGTWLAIAHRDRIAMFHADADGTFRERANLLHPDLSAPLLRFSPSGETLLSASSQRGIDDQGARLWHRVGAVWGDEPTRLEGLRGRVTAAGFMDDSRVVVGRARGSVELWNTSGSLQRELRTTEGAEIRSIAISPLDHSILATSQSNAAYVWDHTGHSLFTLRGHRFLCVAGMWAPGQDRIVTAGRRTIRIWRTRLTELPTLRRPEEGLLCVDFSSDGAEIAAAGFDPAVYLWRWREDRVRELPSDHTRFVRSMRFTPDGRVVTAEADSFVRLTDPNTAEQVPSPTWGRENYSCAPTTDGKLLFATVGLSPDDEDNPSSSSRIVLATLNGLDTLDSFAHPEYVIAVAVSTDDTVAYGERNAPGLWLCPIENGKFGPPERRADVQYGTRGLEFSPVDASMLLIAGATQGWIEDLSTGHRVPLEHGTRLTGCAFSPDGERVLTCGIDGTVMLWNLEGDAIARFEGHRSAVWGVRFHPDPAEPWAVSVSLDGTAQIWCTSSEELLRLATRYADPAARREELVRYRALLGGVLDR